MGKNRERRRPITKTALFIRAVRVSLLVSIAFGVLAWFAVSSTSDAQAGVWEALRFAAGSALGLQVFMLLTLSVLVFQDFRTIAKQEKLYGFRFRDEMEKYQIKTFQQIKGEWFVLVGGCRVYAFRRGFITDFGKQKGSMLGKKLGAKMMVECADGVVRVLGGDRSVLTALQNWVNDTQN